MGRRSSTEKSHPRLSLHDHKTSIMCLTKLGTILTAWWKAAHSSFNINHLGIIAVFLMVILSFVLPDISQKIQRTNEIQRMKKVVQFMTNEVTKAEESCLTVAKDLCFLQYSMHDMATETINEQRNFSVCTSKCLRKTQSEPNQSDKTKNVGSEVFIPKNSSKGNEEIVMSYLYTDSFDAQKN